VRHLSRALDTLRQLGNLPFSPVRRGDMLNMSRGIHPDIRQLCRDAAKGINRYPLKDRFSLDDEDEDEEEYYSIPLEGDEKDTESEMEESQIL
jgi:hypothetical protein